MINVAVVHWGKSGGGAKFSLEISEALSNREDCNLIFSVPFNIDNRSQWDKLTGKKYYVSTYKSKSQAFWLLPKGVVFALRLRRQIVSSNTKVVFSPMFSLWHSILVSLWLPRGVSLISSVHDASPHDGEQSRILDYAQQVERKHSIALATYSSHVSKQLSTKNSIPKVRLNHGVETPRVHSPRDATKSPDAIILGFFGRILPYKGVELFEQAILEARGMGIDARGIVCGSGIFQTKAAESPEIITSKLGWATERDIENFFHSIDVIVLPYLESSQSGVLGLAWSYAVPAIVTPAGGIAEQVDLSGAGLVSNGIDATSIAHRVREIHSDMNLYKKLSDAAFHAAEGPLGWPVIAEELMRHISTLQNRSENL